jgi:uncharacterized protein YndB with AHSA1/START domain
MSLASMEIEPFILGRSFAAPRALVWRCFTEAGHLARWWGPKGCSVEVRRLDLRPGGTFHYSMRFGAAPPMWGRFVFREIDPPEQLVFVNSFSDPEGGLTRAPFDGTWPLEMLSTISFAEEADGGTRVTVRWEPIEPSEAERATFEAGRSSMTQGWTGSFDVLEAYLAELS